MAGLPMAKTRPTIAVSFFISFPKALWNFRSCQELVKAAHQLAHNRNILRNTDYISLRLFLRD